MRAYPPCLLDTDILSELLKGHTTVKERTKEYLSQHGRITFSQIAQYEILKGLQSKNASRQIQAFNTFCRANIILSLTEDAVMRTAEIYAELRETGHLITDADILVAAIAITNQLTLVTNNIAHFSRINGLNIENWKR